MVLVSINASLVAVMGLANGTVLFPSSPPLNMQDPQNHPLSVKNYQESDVSRINQPE